MLSYRAIFIFRLYRKLNLKPRSHYALEIFVCSVRPTVHINPSRKRSFSKPLIKPEEFENIVFAVWCAWEIFYNQVASLSEVSSNTSSNLPLIVAFSNFFQAKRENAVFKFLQSSMDEHLRCFMHLCRR